MNTSEFNDKQIQILQIAERLFAEKGFDGTSIRDISKDAAINIAMVSYYFGSKEKLLESLVIYRTADLKIKLENLFEASLSPVQKLEKFIEFYIEKINKHKNMHQILNFETSSKKRVLDSDAFTEIKKANLETLRKIIQEGKDINVFKNNINIELLIPTILGPYFHFNMNKTYNQELFNIKNEADYDSFIKNELTNHIQQTIKSLITNEN
ncbi:MAG: TetR/AcrR family transcriptional regulator [Flavobacterium sp.]|nr:TetR/AcrR family transcriptional regulator [Flavobacterium sp.]